MEIDFHAFFLTLETDGDEYSISRFGHFIPLERGPNTDCITGSMGLRKFTGVVMKKKSIPPPAVQQVLPLCCLLIV
jgi:hypothetical protein